MLTRSGESRCFLALVFFKYDSGQSVPVAFGGFIGQVQQNSWGSGVLLMYISVIAYLVEGMTRLVEDSRFVI